MLFFWLSHSFVCVRTCVCFRLRVLTLDLLITLIFSYFVYYKELLSNLMGDRMIEHVRIFMWESKLSLAT